MTPSHFIAFVKKMVEHMKNRLRAAANGVQSETPLFFFHRVLLSTQLEAKPLKFAYSR